MRIDSLLFVVVELNDVPPKSKRHVTILGSITTARNRSAIATSGFFLSEKSLFIGIIVKEQSTGGIRIKVALIWQSISTTKNLVFNKNFHKTKRSSYCDYDWFNETPLTWCWWSNGIHITLPLRLKLSVSKDIECHPFFPRKTEMWQKCPWTMSP